MRAIAFNPTATLRLDDTRRQVMGQARRESVRAAMAYQEQTHDGTAMYHEALMAYFTSRLPKFQNDGETLETVERRDFGWTPDDDAAKVDVEDVSDEEIWDTSAGGDGVGRVFRVSQPKAE